MRKPLVIQVVRANEIVSLDVEPPVQVTERRRIPGPRDDAERQEQMRKRLQAQIERLERRLQELKNELERVEREH